MRDDIILAVDDFLSVEAVTFKVIEGGTTDEGTTWIRLREVGDRTATIGGDE